VPFNCYMTVCGKKNDAEQAMKIAKELKLNLNVIKVSEDKIKKALPEVIKLIESADPVKVEVGTTLYFSLKEARKDNIKVIFSGVGADDIFGGYKRMLAAKEINLDSISNLRRMYERDLYRDDVISMYNNIELRLPFLDKELVAEVLKIPSRYKIGETTKPILRSVAKKIGLAQSEMKRKAAQYGSGIANAISKFAPQKGKYLASLAKVKPLKLGVLFSSGKDSAYALHIQQRLNYNISCLITVQSMNEDSYMFHTPNISLVKYQAESMGFPLVVQKTKGKKEAELADLKKAIQKAKEKYHIQGIVTGALFSNYQRSRVEKICDELNLKVFSPLWHMNQEVEMRNLIREGFKVIMVKVAAEGLDKSWLGKVLTSKDADKLVELNKKIGFNIAGEGGEFETFVLDAPMFKSPLEIVKSHIVEDSENIATLAIDRLRFRKSSE
ncbi:diphthine--ammonia ligase, partial [Candidatus Woesearchaeota archaeon]|nr:diphthine--ammonia ligase [Candidatus Woesearchaeota archaeon]